MLSTIPIRSISDFFYAIKRLADFEMLFHTTLSSGRHGDRPNALKC
jgi:hypothetical protein